jgi:hypothetical protein
MTGRLSEKLPGKRSASPDSTSQEADKELCLVVDERWGFSCEFRANDDAIWLFPYHRFTHTETALDGALLKIGFANHEVRVTGKNLDRIKEAIARGRNLLVQAVDAQRKNDYQGDDVFVSLVEVTEAAPRSKTTPQSGEECPEKGKR